MRYAIVLEKSKKNYAAYVPDVPGCIATGTTAAETVEQMRSALQFHLEGMQEDGEPIPDPVTLVEYVDVQLPKRSAAAT
jgi:predicted RNase H-like HicB family nuclease